MNTQKRTTPFNKGLIMGQKKHLRPSQVWEIRTRLKLKSCPRDLALFNLALDSKLRSCDLLELKVKDVKGSGEIRSRVQVMQQKTGCPVSFEITDLCKESLIQ